ncbi:hypothetical protein QFC21_005733 [Naganishia friedmannii]|uniref:Uncharacterized protein n=1 Tax=Naganishia friedmannii TaxID=89922 RepID=A0ACC2V789_9TREE|nr:hypothetical protein QFC21_005733 [Naganishia friedmannii]
MPKNQSSDANDMQLEEKRTYDALIELVEEAKKHLDNLKTDPEPKRPDIPPGIPQSMLPILRKIEQQSQVVKNLLRVPVRPSGAKSKKVEEETKRKRDDPAEENMAVTRTMERQKMKDKLDELGTNLWNRTLLIHRVTKMAREVARQIHDDHSRKQTRQDALAQWDKLFAYTRNAAYSLIQVAGDDRRGVVRFVTRGLELATKTALALFAAGEHEESREVLSSAAELEDILVKKLQKGLDGLSEDQLFRQDCSKHVIEYYLARCIFEVGRDNETLAGTLMMKALSHCNATPNDVPPRSYQHIARKCHEIGSILLSRIDTQGQAAKDEKTGELAVAAAQWFKNGIQLVEAKDGEGEVAKMLAPFKSPLLEGLARASLLSLDKDPDALDRAQTITNDLMKNPDTVDRSKMQTFLMINVQILRRKNAPSPEIMKVMERLIDLQDWDDRDAVDK